jgi:hypothetical protein
VLGLATDSNGSALALVGAPLAAPTAAPLELLRDDRSGMLGPARRIEVEGDARFGQSGRLVVRGDVALAVINRHAGRIDPRSIGAPVAFTWLGLPKVCFGGDAAELRFLALPDLKVRQGQRIERAEVSDALAMDDGWLLVGYEREVCGAQYHAAAWRLGADGALARLWRDDSPFDTFAHSVRRIPGGIEIVGYARRAIAVDLESKSLRQPDFARRRRGYESYVSGEVFAVRLSDTGIEQGRDFVGAGLPLVPSGVAASPAHTIVYGTVGGRALWMER